MSEMIKDLALTLLSDALWSELDSLGRESSTPDLLGDGKHKIFGMASGRDVCEVTIELFQDLNIDLNKHLPIDHTQKIVDAVDRAWNGKLTVQQLYEYNSSAAHRCILLQLGHGVSASDDKGDREWIESHGVTEPSLLFDGPDIYETVLLFQCEWLIHDRSLEVLRRGRYVTLVKDEDGDLKLIPTPELLEDRDRVMSLSFDEAMADILEDHLSNGWEAVDPEDIGALTSGLLLSDGDSIWWDSSYQVQDLREEILSGSGFMFQAEE